MSDISVEILTSTVDSTSISQPRKSVKKIVSTDDEEEDNGNEKKNQDNGNILSEQDNVDENVIKEKRQTDVTRNRSFSDNDSIELAESFYVSKSRINFTPLSPSSFDEKLINEEPFSNVVKQVENENDYKLKLMSDLYDATTDDIRRQKNIETDSKWNTDGEDNVVKIKKSARTKKLRKPTKLGVLQVQKNTQKLLRESTLRLPYHKPEQLTSITAFMDKRRSLKSQTSEDPKNNDVSSTSNLIIPEMQLKILTDMNSNDKMKEEISPNSTNQVSEKLVCHISNSLMKKKPTLARNINRKQIIDFNDCIVKKEAPIPQMSNYKSISPDKPITKSKNLCHLQELLRVQITEKCRNKYLKKQIVTSMSSEQKSKSSPPIKKTTPIRMIKDQDNEDEDNDSEDFILENSSQTSDGNSEMRENEEDTKSNEDHAITYHENDKSENNEEGKIGVNASSEILDDELINPILEQKFSYYDDDDDDIIHPNLPVLQISQQQDELYRANLSLQSDSELLSQREASNTDHFWCERSQAPSSALDDVALLCSGQFMEEDIPCSQNRLNDFFTLPLLPNPIKSNSIEHLSEYIPPLTSLAIAALHNDVENDIQKPAFKRKTRRVSESSDDDKQSMVADDDDEEEEEERQEANIEDNEELIEFRQSLFEIEAEESGSESADKHDAEIEEESNDAPDEELLKFIDTDQNDLNEKSLNDLTKVHMKIMDKEDKQKLKILKDHYLDNDEDDIDERFMRRPSYDEDYDEDTNVDGDDELITDCHDIDTTSDTGLKNKQNCLAQEIQIEHLNEDIQTIGNDSQIFKLGCEIRQKKMQHTISDTDTTEEKQMKQEEVYSATFTSRTTQIIPVSSLTQLSSRYDHLTSKCSATTIGSTTAKNGKIHDPRRLVFLTSTCSKNHSQIDNGGDNESPITDKKNLESNKSQANDTLWNVMDSPIPSNKRFKPLKSPTFTLPAPATNAVHWIDAASKAVIDTIIRNTFRAAGFEAGFVDIDNGTPAFNEWFDNCEHLVACGVNEKDDDDDADNYIST
ncbi:unnamed protein product [Didymodactylos carnosus]|uniref:Uncharacterized protein n=1 Tax=Didymodactylos carnosus TaxID=1234261 RepID=A0A8S2H1T5_9BILA|nr:unnamed protein product [Didymodactylos carnosus]CAF3590595.1 unnamed protein product [Didymodactylos carnosus]